MIRTRRAGAAGAAGLAVLVGLVGPAAASAGRPALQVPGTVPAVGDARLPLAGPVLAPLLATDPAVDPDPDAAADPDAGVVATSPGAPLDRASVAAALRPLLSGGALGPGRTPARVVDVASGEVLYAAAGSPTVPASTMKLVTATSVLDSLGADHRLRTRVVLVEGGRVPRLVVVGAGDPSLASTPGAVGSAGSRFTPASMEQLAARAARALSLRGEQRVRLGYDGSLFTGSAIHPTWASGFPALGIIAPVSALQVDEGRSTPTSGTRVPDPALRAAQVLAEQLAEAGVAVRGEPRPWQVGDDDPTLAFVDSPPLGVLVERMLAASDNDFAEALGRIGAAASGQPASFTGVARRARALLRELGVTRAGARFADASGLSRRNALAPATLTDLLRATVDGFGPIHSGLPVAGATGSLAARFGAPDQADARGVVRAKTGTLTSVVGLAGYASRPDGRLLAFAFLDDSAPGPLSSRAALDTAAAALVACSCAAGGS